MTAVDAYAGYLRSAAGLDPETAIQGRSATVTARHATSVLIVTFKATPGELDWTPTGIRLTRGGATTAYRRGQLATAVTALRGAVCAAPVAALAGAAPAVADGTP